MTPAGIPAVFVSPRVALLDTPGGVQLYTRELMECLELAGFGLTVIGHESDMRITVRLKRKLRPRPYCHNLPPDLPGRISEALRRTGAKFVFLNGVTLAPLAAELREKQSDSTVIVLLSYGLESVDFLHESRATGQTGPRAAQHLGRQLFAEAEQREAIDHVFCLAPFEAAIEQWIGARHVDWLPRSRPEVDLFKWNPAGDKLGCASRLDHPPNWEGLTLYLQELTKLAPPFVRFRLVGAPATAGRRLAIQFPIVDYLGAINDDDLVADAQTWSCFVHPLFCYARGASTKLGVALGWGLPVVTTTAGARGYVWRDGAVPLAETPEKLAELSLSMLDSSVAATVQEQVRRVAASMPSRHDVAQRLLESLKSHLE